MKMNPVDLRYCEFMVLTNMFNTSSDKKKKTKENVRKLYLCTREELVRVVDRIA